MLYVTNVPDDVPYQTRHINRKGKVIVARAKPTRSNRWALQLGVEANGATEWLPEWTHSAQDRDEALYVLNWMLAYYNEGREPPYTQQAQAV